MGLFSGKKTSVSTAAMHLADAGKDPILTALITAILENTNIPEEIMRTMLNGLGVKMRPAFNYAKAHYTLGLPSGKVSSYPQVSNEDLEAIIATDIVHPDGVIVSANLFTTLTPALMILPDLIQQRGYDTTTNEITLHPEGVVYSPYCITPIFHEQSGEIIGCNLWEDPTTVTRRMTILSVFLSPDETEAEVTYALWTRRLGSMVVGGDNNDEIIHFAYWRLDELTYTENFPISNPNNYNYDTPCVYANYKTLDASGVASVLNYTWLYMVVDGTYPELDPINNPPALDEYLPVVPIRYYNVDYTDESRDTTPLWITSRRLLRKLAMDFERLGDQINKNPDVAEIDHAYVMFGVDLQTNISDSIWYLGLFFQHLYSLQEKNKIDYINQLSTPGSNPDPLNSYKTNVVEEANFLEHGLNLNVKFGFITSELRVGRIAEGRAGRVGKAKKGHSIYSVTKTRSGGFGGRTWSGDGGDSGRVMIDRSYQVNEAKLIIDMQIAKRVIRRVTVTGLEIHNKIYRRYGITTKYIDVVESSEEHNLIIPMQYHIAQSMKLWKRNMLYVDGGLMVINTYVVTKLKWYETGFFKFLLLVVAMIITIYTGQAWLLGLVAALEATALAVIIYLVKAIIVSYLLNLAMSWLIKKFGAKLGIIGAIILTVVAMVVSKGASFNMAGLVLSTSQAMMQVAMALISAVNEFLVDAGQKLVDEYLEFRNKMSDRWEELKTAQELLDNKHDLDPLTFARPSRYRIAPNESPTAFFQRCMGLPDNSLYTIHDQIPLFHSSAIKLDRGIGAELYNQNISI